MAGSGALGLLKVSRIQRALSSVLAMLTHRQTAIAPLLVAAALYLLLSFVILPFYRRYRADIARYSQYAPVASTLQTTTSIFGDYIPDALRPRSIREKLGDLFFRLVLPSTWARRRGRGEQDGEQVRRDSIITDEDGGLFDEESGERMVGFDMNEGRRAVDGRRRTDGGLGIRDSGESDAINAAIGRSTHEDLASTRRLSRELEEGFRDDSGSELSDEEVTVGRRRLSMASTR